MTYDEIIERVAHEVGLSPEVVEKTYRGFFMFIRDSIQKLPLKESLDEKQFNELKTNFNIPSLGKFTCTYDRMCRVKKRFEYINNLKKDTNEHKED